MGLQCKKLEILTNYMQQSYSSNEEWLRVLGKGMITIPKSWREEYGLKEGNIVKAKKTSKGIIIEPQEKKVPYRIYSKQELNRFIKEDQL